MRVRPADFDQKVEDYINVGAALISTHRVPQALVLNGDETNVLFVPHATRTRSKKGAKRIRVICVGKDKAQITCTIFLSESGEVLPYQLIFGGKTDRCHPKGKPPTGCIWTHTPSHWQSVATYKNLITKILVPYHERTVKELGLSEDQVMILKHDLHFTHKSDDVIKLCKQHKIEMLQECDCVAAALLPVLVQGTSTASNSASSDPEINNQSEAAFDFQSFLTMVPEGEEVDNEDVDFIEDEIAYFEKNEENDDEKSEKSEQENEEDTDEDEAEQFANELDAILAE